MNTCIWSESCAYSVQLQALPSWDRTMHKVTSQKQGLIEIERRTERGFVPCRQKNSKDSCKYCILDWCECEVLPNASFLMNVKCVDKSWMSCWSWIAAGVGWHSLCGAASQTDAGPLERSLCLCLWYFSIAQFAVWEYPASFLQCKCSTENPQPHYLIIYQCFFIFWGLICPRFVDKDMSLAVFSLIRLY